MLILMLLYRHSLRLSWSVKIPVTVLTIELLKRCLEYEMIRSFLKLKCLSIFSYTYFHDFQQTFTKLLLPCRRDGYEIGEIGAGYLADALRYKAVKVYVFFNYSYVHIYGFQQTLTEINLGGHHIGDQGVQLLTDSLRNNKVDYHLYCHAFLFIFVISSRHLSNLIYIRIKLDQKELNIWLICCVSIW